MKNPVDIVGILEWASRQGKSERTSERRRKPPEEDDLLTVLHKRRAENQALEHFFKDIEKLSKKEEHKQEGLFGRLTTTQLAMVLIGTFPITGPLYVAWVQKVLGH